MKQRGKQNHTNTMTHTPEEMLKITLDLRNDTLKQYEHCTDERRKQALYSKITVLEFLLMKFGVDPMKILSL